MAAIQLRNDSWRVLFRYQGQQQAITIGKVPASEAITWKGRVEQILLRLKQHWAELPEGMTITDFILRDGKPVTAASKTSATTFGQLREKYVAAKSSGSVETNTIGTINVHLDHFEKALGKTFLLSGLSLAKLQDYVNARAQDTVKALDKKKLAKGIKRKTRKISAVTIRKELVTFAAAWKFGTLAGLVQGEFPASGLEFPKTNEKLPFMTIAECHRRIRAGADPAQVYESLYLDSKQITKLLAWLKSKKCAPWFHPLIVAAAHLGARRSELLRMKVEDIDLAAKVVTIQEKKRSKGRNTVRRVPITPLLATTIKPLMTNGRIYLFGDGKKPISVNHAKLTFKRIFSKSPWKMVRGYHVMRHSWCSIMASLGTDQRVIDDCLGHSTEQQRKRYRHLFPQVTQDAIAKAFS